eukprot:27117-Amorphochlora_amoeboformis.AAC.1
MNVRELKSGSQAAYSIPSNLRSHGAITNVTLEYRTDQTLGLVPRKDKSGRPLVELLPEDQN